MVNESGARGDDPQALLSATRDLTHRVRIAQRGAWFSLLAFAGVTFAAIPFTRYGDHPAHCSSIHGGGYVCSVHSALALWYWPIALLAAYLATAWFSVRRAEHRGVGTRAQPFVVVGAVLTMLATVWAFWADAHPAFLAGTLRLQPGQPTQFLYRVASPAGAVGLALLLLASIERIAFCSPSRLPT